MHPIIDQKIQASIGRLTIQQIADHTGLGKSMLRRYLKRQGIKQCPKLIQAMRKRASAKGGMIFAERSRLPRNERLMKYRQRNANQPRNYHAIRRANNKRRCVERMGGKCGCGYDKSLAALHVLRPEGRVLGSIGLSNWEKVKRESEVYELVCSNCLAEKRSLAISEGSIESEKNNLLYHQ
jgi:hypothetical protein